MDNYSLEYNYNLTERLNTAAGNLENVTYASLHKQALLIQEELSETINKGILLKDPKEVLDGCCDIIVTAFGFMQMLQAAGFQTSFALDLVCENNDTKLFEPDAITVADDTIKLYAEQNIPTALFYNEATKRYTVKDANGKIRKPKGFQSVNLEPCIVGISL